MRERGATVILSTHLLAEVETTCNRVLILNRGRIAAQGTVAEVVRRAAAPRRALLRVPYADRQRAVGLLTERGVQAEALDGDRDGDVRLTLPGGAGDATRCSPA